MEEQDTAFAVIKKKWADILSNVSQQKQVPLPSMQTSYEGFMECQAAVEGWAFKTVQKSSRMSDDVRNYLTQKFNDGAQKGNKADPKQVEHEMKHTRKSTGGLSFQPHEWRISKQIASFFSSFSKSQSTKNVEGETESIESKDAELANQDRNLQALQLAVDRQLQADHSTILQGHNLCDLAKEGKMRELQLDTLKKAYLEFNVEVQSKEEHFCYRNAEVHLYPPIQELQILGCRLRVVSGDCDRRASELHAHVREISRRRDAMGIFGAFPCDLLSRRRRFLTKLGCISPESPKLATTCGLTVMSCVSNYGG